MEDALSAPDLIADAIPAYPATAAIDALSGMRAVFDVCSDGMALFDADGRITLTNRRFEELLQLPAEYLHGKRLTALHADFARLFGDPGALAPGLRGTGGGQRLWTVAQRWPEERQLHCRFCSLPRVGPRAGVLAMQPLAAEREPLRDRFLALTARELRTPLASIAGFAELLLAEDASNLTERQREYLGFLRDDVLHERTVIEQVMELLTIDAGRIVLQRHPVALELVLRRAAAPIHQRLAAAKQRLVLENPRHFPPVTGDAERLTQAIAALFAQAQDRSAPGDQIRVQVRGDGQDVRIWVHDDGPDLTDEEDRWLRLHLRRAPLTEPPPEGGIPLGLLLAQTVAHLHGGALDVAAAPEGGVDYVLRLPCTPEGIS